MAARRKKKGGAFVVAVMTVAVALIFVSLCDRYPALGDRVSTAISVFTGPAAIQEELQSGILEVQIIDVGQGECILVRAPEGNILIDSGTEDSEYELDLRLGSLGIEAFDYFICTHPHDDHIGGADMICNNYGVSKLLVSDVVSHSLAEEKLFDAVKLRGIASETPKNGDVFSLGEVKFTVIGPVKASDDLNDMSIAIKLEYGDTSFVFTGDAREYSELAMLEYYGEDFLDCDFYNVGHHGSSTSSAEEFLAALTPEIAAISCGENNEHGHPHYSVIERLENAGCEAILRTDIHGTVVVRSDGSEITVISPEI